MGGWILSESDAEREARIVGFVNEKLDFNAETGKLTFRETGEKAVKANSGRHWVFTGVEWIYAETAVWIMYHGGLPPCRLGHGDKNPRNYRIENLTVRTEDGGIVGGGAYWRSSIDYGVGGRFTVGLCSTYEEAVAAREAVFERNREASRVADAHRAVQDLI